MLAWLICRRRFSKRGAFICPTSYGWCCERYRPCAVTIAGGNGTEDAAHLFGIHHSGSSGYATSPSTTSRPPLSGFRRAGGRRPAIRKPGRHNGPPKSCPGDVRRSHARAHRTRRAQSSRHVAYYSRPQARSGWDGEHRAESRRSFSEPLEVFPHRCRAVVVLEHDVGMRVMVHVTQAGDVPRGAGSVVAVTIDKRSHNSDANRLAAWRRKCKLGFAVLPGCPGCRCGRHRGFLFGEAPAQCGYASRVALAFAASERLPFLSIIANPRSARSDWDWE